MTVIIAEAIINLMFASLERGVNFSYPFPLVTYQFHGFTTTTLKNNLVVKYLAL